MVEVFTGCWDDNTHEIVHIDLKSVAARAVCPSRGQEGCQGRVPPHMSDKLVWGETADRSVAISRRDVSRHFSRGAEVWWGFHLAHLQGCGHDQGDRFFLLLGEDICEIVLFAFSAVHPSEAVLDIPFCHKYLVVLLGLGRCMENTAKSMPQLIQCALRSQLDG